jgi:uncharacterized protein YndB with AHSA1/START domain
MTDRNCTTSVFQEMKGGIFARKEPQSRNHLMPHPDYDREIRITRTARTTRDKIWSCWTTESGMGSWWTQNCRIEPRAGGAYELYFLMDNPPGTQGGEGNTILAFEPETHLSFSWNAPPTQPETRNQHTVVDLRITDLSPAATEVELLHRGFGIGPAWDITYAYFQGAWTTVMDRLIAHFGPD